MSVLREAAMADDSRSRLGRGLASLIGDVGTENPANDRGTGNRSQRKLPIEHVRANPHNPRKTFAEAELADLTNSIRERGIIQPIIVRAVKGTEHFEIIAGERRWRAARPRPATSGGNAAADENRQLPCRLTRRTPPQAARGVAQTPDAMPTAR